MITIRALRDQVNERMQKISSRRKAEIQKLADSVLMPLAAVEAEVYQVKNRSSQDPLNFPIMLNNKIAALAGVVESADSKPTDAELRGVHRAERRPRRTTRRDAAGTFEPSCRD